MQAQDGAWMIEMVASPNPLWFDGKSMTGDPNAAIRFPSKESAEAMFSVLFKAKILRLGWDCYSITEHQWSALAPPASAASELPNPHEMAEAMAAVSRGSTCPLCGWNYPHQHSPVEIIIYRNGVKWGRHATQPWTGSDDQGLAQELRSDPGAVSGEDWAEPNEHHEYRGGQSDSDRASDDRDCGGAGLPTCGEFPSTREIGELDSASLAAPAASEPVGHHMPSEPVQEPIYLIFFDDQDVRPEIITSGAAARERFRRVSDQWNAHLFVKVQSNTRDDPAYSRNAPQPPAASSDAQPNRWMHVKSGGIYDVLMTAKSEADSTLVTIYRGVESLIIWAQPTREFMDGRFVRVDAAIKGEQT